MLGGFIMGTICLFSLVGGLIGKFWVVILLNSVFFCILWRPLWLAVCSRKHLFFFFFFFLKHPICRDLWKYSQKHLGIWWLLFLILISFLARHQLGTFSTTKVLRVLCGTIETFFYKIPEIFWLTQLFKANSPLQSTTIWFPTNDANVDRCNTHFISSYKQCYRVHNSISLSLPDLLRDQQLCRRSLLHMISQRMAEIVRKNMEKYDDLNFNSPRHLTKY